MADYDAIWYKIKTTGSAEVTVSKAFARTLENGVKRVKTAENTSRRRVGLVGWSKLVVKRTQLSEHRIKIRFELLYSTAL
jgi:hypothetical protein